MKIKAISKVPFDGTVYNLGVEDDESYIANGIVVHNCRCILVPVTRFELQRLMSKGEGIEVSTKDDLPGNFPDEGFKQYASNTKSIVVTIDVPDMQKEPDDLSKLQVIEELTKRLGAIESSIDKQSELNIENDVENAKLQTDKSELQSELDALKTTLTAKKDLDDRLASAQFELDRLNKQNGELQSKISAVKTENTDLMSLFNVTRDKKDEIISELATAQEQLQTKINQLMLDVKDKKKVDSELQLLQDAMFALTQKKQGLEDQISTLEKNKTALSSEHTTELNLLNARIDYLTKELGDRFKVDALKKPIDITRCPFPNCGSSTLSPSIVDASGMREVTCLKCGNKFQVTANNELYLFDKVKNEWLLANLKDDVEEKLKEKIRSFMRNRAKFVKELGEKSIKTQIKERDREITRCPFPNCGSEDLTFLKPDTLGTREVICNKCSNRFKVTLENELYLFDKIKNEWVRPDMAALPGYITGDR